VFTQSVIWGINAFDQWGVELGKKLADSLAPSVENPAIATDERLAPLLGYVARWRT
jgi:glucose-6-phosphate isomerase